MADVYFFLVMGISGVLLVGFLAHGIAGALRGSSGSEVGRRMTRWAGWMLVAAVIFLVAESILMLLGDCSFADLDEIRWRPSLAWWPAIVHRWVLCALLALLAAPLLFRSIRTRLSDSIWKPCRHALSALWPGREGAPPLGIRLLAAALLVGSVATLVGVAGSSYPYLRVFDWDTFIHHQGLDGDSLGQWAALLFCAAGVVACSHLSCRLVDRDPYAWGIALGLFVCACAATAVFLGYMIVQGLTHPGASQPTGLSGGLKVLAALYLLPVPLFALALAIYLWFRRDEFCRPKSKPAGMPG